jgi:hypothetical protein
MAKTLHNRDEWLYGKPCILIDLLIYLFQIVYEMPEILAKFPRRYHSPDSSYNGWMTRVPTTTTVSFVHHFPLRSRIGGVSVIVEVPLMLSFCSSYRFEGDCHWFSNRATNVYIHMIVRVDSQLLIIFYAETHSHFSVIREQEVEAGWWGHEGRLA